MIFLLLKGRKASHPINVPYKQPSGRMVMRVLTKTGKVKIVPVKKEKVKKTKKPSVSKNSLIREIHVLPLSKVEAAEGGQIRKRFDKKKLQTLADAIHEAGLMQPIVVRPHPTKKGKYEIIAGERRFRAHKMLHESGKAAAGDPLGHIQAKIIDATTAEKNAKQFIENFSRQDNTPMEIADAIKAAFDAGESFEDIARARGQRIDVIKNHYSLTTLDPDIQRMIENKEIPKKAGFLLAGLPVNEQGVFAGKFVREKWSVRTLDNHIFNFLNQQKLFEPGAEKTSEMKAAEAKLEGKDPHEINQMFRDFVSRFNSFVDKFFTQDGDKLSALALTASGTLDQNLRYIEMIQEKLSQAIARMKTEHHNLVAPSMFEKSTLASFNKKNSINELQRLQKDLSIFKSLVKLKRRHNAR